MDGACIFKSITKQGCFIPAPAAGDAASPRGAALGLGRVQAHPEDPELWGLWGRGRGSLVGPPRRPQNDNCFPRKRSAKSSA